MKVLSAPREDLKKLVPTIAEQQINQLEKFVNSLREWNQRYNLISRKDINQIWEHHIFPSLVPLKLFELPPNCWLLDIGSGGGLPAIPIKIVRPDLEMLLADSVRKKTLFLQKMISDIQLKNIIVKRDRIEALRSNAIYAEKFDIVTARAVASISTLIEWSRPFLKQDGFLLLWKGLADLEELVEIATEKELNYEIQSVPDHLKSLSQKFSELRFFKTWF